MTTSTLYFTASILKKSKYIAKLGLTLQQQPHNDAVTIKDLSPSFKKKTALVPGLRVLEINHTKITSLSEANRLLAETPVNFEVTLTVQAQIVSATKASTTKKGLTLGRSPPRGENQEQNGEASSKIGISLFQDPESAQISITHVAPDSLFPTLRANTILHAINGILVSSISFAKVKDIMKQCKILTLVVLDNDSVEEVGSPSQPQTQKSEALHQQNGSVGKVENAPNDGGVEMDNGNAVGDHQPNTSENSNESIRVVACIIRPSKNVPLGLKLEEQDEEVIVSGEAEEVEKPDGGNGNGVHKNKTDVVKKRQKLVVTSVEQNGLFANTGLQSNMELVKINGHVWSNIRKHKLDKAMKLLQQATGRISLEAVTTPLDNSSKTDTIGERQIFSIEKANRSFALGLQLTKLSNSQKVEITEASAVFENVLGLKTGLLLSKVNNIIVTSAHQAQALMADAYPILSLECEAPPPPDKQSLLQEEYLLAKHALPVTVTEENKDTAKIVRTNVCELPADTKLQKMWTVAKHPELNGIVICDIPKSSPFYEYFAVGQVVVSINHNTCPQTSAGTYKLLQKEMARAAAMAADPKLKAAADPTKANTVVRVEAGDVQHEHVPTTEDEEEMHQAVQLAIARAENELLDRKDNRKEESSDPPELVSESELEKPKDMFSLPDDVPEHPVIRVDFDEGVQLPKTPKNLAVPAQTLQWTRSKPGNNGGVPAEIGLFESSPSPLKMGTPKRNNGFVPTDSDSEKAQAKCTIPKDDTDDHNENGDVTRRILFNAENPASAPAVDLIQTATDKIASVPSAREQELEEQIQKIQSELKSAQSALKSAEGQQEKAKGELTGEISALRQQLEDANEARQVAEDGIRQIGMEIDHELKIATEAKINEEKQRLGLKKMLEELQEESMKSKANASAVGDNLRSMVLEVQNSCANAKDELLRIKSAKEAELKTAVEEKEKAEQQVRRLKARLLEAQSDHDASLRSKQAEIEEKSAAITNLRSEISSLKRQLQQAEAAKDEAKGDLEKAKADHENEILGLKVQIDLVREEEETKADEREAQTRAEADDAVGSMLEMQRHDKEEIVNLRNLIEDAQIALHNKEQELEKLHKDFSIVRSQEANQAKAAQEALENELGVHREQVASLQASLVAAEKVRQMSKSEVKAVKSDGHVKLQTETEARRRAEKEIVRLEAEVDNALQKEQETKKKLEDLKKEFETSTGAIEARERKNRSMAEEAREKAEIIVADIEVAEERRIKAEAEVVKTRRTWSLISLFFFVIAILSARSNHQGGSIPEILDLDLSTDDLRTLVRKEAEQKLELEKAVKEAIQDRDALLEAKEAAEEKADEAMKEATRKETLLQQAISQNKGVKTSGDGKSPSEEHELQNGESTKAQIVAQRRAAPIEIYFE
ncbi:unnamed protein product [Cylindrotheca closterium]|uniref:PDZ domain-containing protein n=1 Tax=Cylindrotheca closterium TaxID=2856 RepID=A0AAD2FEV3_9STRA|nr:unnamed protein product [Cylindrotheca closterium]